MSKVHLTLKSSNIKTGEISVSTTEEDSCPTSCPLRRQGCYADGYPLKGHWNRVPDIGLDWDDFCQTVQDKATALWRHNQAGDLPHKNGQIDADKVFKLEKACRLGGKKGFTYTHHDMSDSMNRLIVMICNKAASLVINLSGNSMSHADDLAELVSFGHKPAPVTTVMPSFYERKHVKKGVWSETYDEYRSRVDLWNIKTPKGKKVTVCPATYRDDMDCAKCKLCAMSHRETIIGFPAHGNRKAKASEIANDTK